jgi:ubiquinone/menaquinone biosynthesis C-methylase UbiE
LIRIEIAERNYLLYLLLPHPAKIALLSPASRERLDRINRGVNESIYSGQGATAYDTAHRYAEAEQHEYPASALIDRVWAPEGYGRVLELGAGTGYFTARIARRARSVLAVEPVPDMQRVLRARCRAESLGNVEVLGVSAFDLAQRVPPASVDSAVVIQSLHHVHRRPEVFEILGRAVRPGGRLYMVEPHHNVRRAARLLRTWLAQYRAPEFWSDELNWATHDFLTRGELRALCRRGGFEVTSIGGYWIPYSRRLIRDPERRFALERRLGRLPGLRHWAGVLSVEAVRSPR